MSNTPTILLVRFGEIHLKGLNRPYFINALLRRVRAAVRSLGGTALHEQGRIYVRGLTDMDEGARRVANIFGVHSVSPVVEAEKNYDAIRDACIELTRALEGTFKVLARRADKAFPMDSNALCRELGGDILQACGGRLSVDVHKPEHELNVEIRESAYLYINKIPGVGGMPVGTGGKAMLLLSGGIDSPVAGYMIAKRGVEIDAVHFHSPPFTGELARRKVEQLAMRLCEYCGTVNLFVVPFTDVQKHLHQNGPGDYLTILMRRAMMRIAQRLAEREGCQALVTGESVGQVASQTMWGLCATDAVASMPVFRPLIGFDKQEIVEKARAIGTFDTSILPYEDCCTIFTPRHPSTRPRLDRLVEAEEGMASLGALLDAALEGTERVRLGGER